MRVRIFQSKVLVILALISFIFFLSSDALSQKSSSQRSEVKKLLREGKSHYRNGEYEEAIKKLAEAPLLTKDKEELTEIYFYLSLSYYSNNQNEKAEEMLRKLFEMKPNLRIVDESLYPEGFVRTFYKIREEMLGKAEEKSEVKEVEKPEVKEKVEKPKKSYTALYILAGLAVAGGVAYLLLTKSKKEEGFGNISINSEPQGAKVYLDGQDTGKRTNTTLTNIKTGTHQLKLELELYGKWEGNVEVKKNYTTNVDAKLLPFKYEFVTKWGSYGSGDYQFDRPFGVAVDSSGNVYGADTNNHRIMKFTSNGSFITKWGSEGSGDYQFILPSGVAVDSSGNVYVADTWNNRIMKFTSNGSFITKWGSYGSGDYQFYLPSGVAVDSSGNVYVADTDNHRIMKFTSNGSFITKWGSYGSGDYQFIYPFGVAVDSSGNVYVADSGNSRIMKFRISSQTTFQVNISYSPINERFNLFTSPSQKEPKEKSIQREKTKENQ